MTHPIFDDLRTKLTGGVKCRSQLHDVIWVNVIEKMIAYAFLIERYAQDAGSRRTPIKDPHGVVHHNGHVGRMLDESSKPLLACSHRCLGRLAVGDVAADSDDACNATCVIAVGSLHRHIGMDCAVGSL